MILVNFKIYKNTFGEGSVRLAKICKKAMDDTGVTVIPVVSPFDVSRVVSEVGIKVLIQNVDVYQEGRHNGAISALQAYEVGARGSLINHSETKIPLGLAATIVSQVPSGFETVVCVHSYDQAEKWIKKIKPKTVAYEPSYLIESKDKSVSSEKPEIIQRIAKAFPEIDLLVGAGVHDQEDVATALKLGAKGVLVASDVVKADDPEKELTDLCYGFSSNQETNGSR